MLLRLIFIVGVVIFVVGCAHVPINKKSAVIEFPEDVNGIYHVVKKGETLWRIAKAYDVGLFDIMKVNRIVDPSCIEEGQLIFIPGAECLQDIALDTSGDIPEFIWPINGRVVRDFSRIIKGNINKGIDIEAEEGENFVKAACTGRVVFADYLSGYGYCIIMRHEKGYYSVYAHNSRLLVNTGDFILKGKVIAMAEKGRDKAYLHFEIRKGIKEENPLFYLP